jgi:CMP-N-acetylneuraminic acid synthetase
MKKIIAMIPARIGSKRIPRKNLRLIDGKPLVAYILETLKKVKLFDEIYLNADDIIFEKIAKYYDVNFYFRDKRFSSDTSTNDEFALDFIENVEGDILIQVLPTSPLITAQEIEDFTKYMIEKKLESLISVEHKQIACIYDNQALNFDKYKMNPFSQDMKPVKAYATVLMGWEHKSFKKNMKNYGSAYHGGNSKIDYYQLKGLSTLDIDNEEDFLLAEAIIKSLKNKSKTKVEFFE